MAKESPNRRSFVTYENWIFPSASPSELAASRESRAGVKFMERHEGESSWPATALPPGSADVVVVEIDIAANRSRLPGGKTISTSPCPYKRDFS